MTTRLAGKLENQINYGGFYFEMLQKFQARTFFDFLALQNRGV
jgi:hypothetical protein